MGLTSRECKPTLLPCRSLLYLVTLGAYQSPGVTRGFLAKVTFTATLVGLQRSLGVDMCGAVPLAILRYSALKAVSHKCFKTQRSGTINPELWDRPRLPSLVDPSQ